jgi:hypothetical protein
MDTTVLLFTFAALCKEIRDEGLGGKSRRRLRGFFKRLCDKLNALPEGKRGELFEIFVYKFLSRQPFIKEIYLKRDAPQTLLDQIKFPRQDYGDDLIIVDKLGKIRLVQVKFHWDKISSGERLNLVKKDANALAERIRTLEREKKDNCGKHILFSNVGGAPRGQWYKEAWKDTVDCYVLGHILADKRTLYEVIMEEPYPRPMK